MTSKILPTAERLRELFHFDPETGIFTRRVSVSNVKAGDVAGFLRVDGYWYIRVDGTQYLAHRLAWLYVSGSWPVEHIDHINGDEADNRLVNLREVTHAQNMQNRNRASVISASGVLGVNWYPKYRKWVARIVTNGKRRHLGYFSDIGLARDAYIAAKRELHSTCTI